MPSRTPWLVWWFPALVAAPLAAQRPTPVLDRQLIAAGIWAEARYNYAYWDAVRANWDSAFAATLNYASAGTRVTDLQLFRRLRRWVALLNDGQVEVLPPTAIASRMARPPLLVRGIERRAFIIDWAANDEMRVARPERLAEIVAVQGIPAADWIRDSVLPETPGATEISRWERAIARMLEGERGTALHLQLRLPSGDERGASITRSVALTERWPLERPPLEADTLPDGAVWLRVNSLADPDAVRRFDAAVGQRARGIVLDLRETTWTSSGRENGYAILARLIDRPIVTSRWRTPQYRPAYRGTDTPDSSGAWLAAASDTIAPRRDRAAYLGPAAVLSSGRTAGAAEDFVVAFRNGARGPVIGETTAGSTGQTLLLPLTAGWQFRVTVTRDAFPDGTEFVRTGIAPELPMTPRVEDLLVGRDAALDRAREYLASVPLVPSSRSPRAPRAPRR
jgi:hypothetical protein